MSRIRVNILAILLSFFVIDELFAQDNKIIKISQSSELEEEQDDFEDFNFDVSAKKEIYDPLEKINRKIFIFNDVLDRNILEPVTIYYSKSLPDPVIKSIRNFITNIQSPFTVVNSLLQGDGQNSMASFSSFLINSTLGVGGLFNVAGSKQINYNEEDFGQTLAVYGFGSGVYLMLPFFGPSNLRDASGMVVTNSVSPLSLNLPKTDDDELFGDKFLLGFTTLSIIDKRESLLKIMQDLRKNSFDLYATIRSAYTQNREAQISNSN